MQSSGVGAEHSPASFSGESDDPRGGHIRQRLVLVDRFDRCFPGGVPAREQDLRVTLQSPEHAVGFRTQRGDFFYREFGQDHGKSESCGDTEPGLHRQAGLRSRTRQRWDRAHARPAPTAAQPPVSGVHRYGQEAADLVITRPRHAAGGVDPPVMLQGGRAELFCHLPGDLHTSIGGHARLPSRCAPSLHAGDDTARRHRNAAGGPPGLGSPEASGS
jgi:hypothetical protein